MFLATSMMQGLLLLAIALSILAVAYWIWWSRLTKYFSAGDPQPLQGTVTNEQIAALENALQAPIPSEMKEAYLNGQLSNNRAPLTFGMEPEHFVDTFFQLNPATNQFLQ